MQTSALAQQLEGERVGRWGWWGCGFMRGEMCHVYFVSTAMDSWSGFRGYTVIFRHVSVPLNSDGACVYVQKQHCLL